MGANDTSKNIDEDLKYILNKYANSTLLGQEDSWFKAISIKVISQTLSCLKNNN